MFEQQTLSLYIIKYICKMKKILLLFTLFILASCATRKDVVYFQDSEDVGLVPIHLMNEHPKIQVNDILNIKVHALNPESVVEFNIENVGGNQQPQRIELLRLTGYNVDEEGYIQFPKLGKIRVEGLTTKEAEEFIKTKLTREVVDPSVKIMIINFKFTVHGEVRNPGTFDILDNNVTLPQALGFAGDLTINGRRDNVTIFRTENDKRIVTHLDLTTTDWMNSPFYFVKQNDYIYVEPNNPKVSTAGYVGNVGTLLSVVSILLTTAVLIFR